jgi:hypothetical protein
VLRAEGGPAWSHAQGSAAHGGDGAGMATGESSMALIQIKVPEIRGVHIVSWSKESLVALLAQFPCAVGNSTALRRADCPEDANAETIRLRVGGSSAGPRSWSRHMDQLMSRYFKGANFDEQNRTLFALASYNAGPGNISKMRKEAAKRGLDPISGSTMWRLSPPRRSASRPRPTFATSSSITRHTSSR